MTKYSEDTGDARLDLALGRLNEGGWGSNWSVTNKRKTISKFGRNASLSAGTTALLWENGPDEETMLDVGDGNLIDAVSSSSTGDTTQTMVVEGHKFIDADGNMEFVHQEVDLNGRTTVTLDTPMCRCSRAYIVGDAAVAGDIWIFQDHTTTLGVPNTLSLTHNVILGSIGEVQSFKAQTTCSYIDALIIMSLNLSIQRGSNANVDLRIEVRKPGQGFRPVFGDIALRTGAKPSDQLTFDPPLIVPPNSDVRIRATPSANNTSGYATFSGYFAVKPIPR